MSLTPGARLGVYEITAQIGEGGMGAVYRGTDTTLSRQVAIKILPDAFAADSERLARFEREAKMLAALNHPNIAAIYGFEKSSGLHALVMELVEGEDLSQRISRGAIPIDEALPIAKQIAEALEAAHEQGIIHRDLKPANIKVRPDGTVKVLDFGLAKAMEPAGAMSASHSMSPTITTPAMTQAGMILGTAAYMSPEQARGKTVDRRADIWAFGAVLFEMLTAQRAFHGEDITVTLARVVERDPDWSALPANTPSPLRTLLRRCLEKDRRRRLDSAVALRLEIEESELAGSAVGPAIARVQSSRWCRAPFAVAGALGVTLAVVVALWAPWQTAAPLAPMRFAIVPPAAEPLAFTVTGRQLALSPDGGHLVYVASGTQSAGGTQLMVRALDRVEAEPLRGITNASFPFISPDGRWVGFFQGAELKKVSISGGPPIVLCRIPGDPRGASWGSDDTIVFATAGPSSGLMSVAAGGGDPTVLTKPDIAQSEIDHYHPFVLPGGRAVLFTAFMPGGIDRSQVAVLDLETGQHKTLIRGGGAAQYLESGHLVYAAAGTLRAVRFDPVRLEVLTDPVPVLEEVSVRSVSGVAEFSVSRTGTLVYIPAAPGGPDVPRSLVWVSRQGREEPVTAPPRAYYALRLSPDGARAALDIRDQENDIWVWDFMRRTLTRLTFNPGGDVFPVWTPDGRRIVFRHAGANALMARSADGTGADERLAAGASAGLAMSFSPDGKSLVVMDRGDLGLMPMDGKGEARPLVQTTTFTEGLGEISPDGRWLAYQSNESGQDQIYVRPFPDVNSGRWLVSPGGGTKPAWARNVRELFYLDGAGALTTVPIQTTPAFSAGNPTKLFDMRYFSAVNARSYDVSPDGQRFLAIKDMPAAAQTSTETPASIVVVLNWGEELKRLVPTN